MILFAEKAQSCYQANNNLRILARNKITVRVVQSSGWRSSDRLRITLGLALSCRMTNWLSRSSDSSSRRWRWRLLLFKRAQAPTDRFGEIELTPQLTNAQLCRNPFSFPSFAVSIYKLALVRAGQLTIIIHDHSLLNSEQQWINPLYETCVSSWVHQG